MSVRALVGKMRPDDVYDYAVLFDSVTETAFGPLTSEREVPDGDLWGAMERFACYVRCAEGKDPRLVDEQSLGARHRWWLEREKQAQDEKTRIETIETTYRGCGPEYARKLAAVYGLELDADGKIVDEEVGPEEEESAAGLALLKAAKPCRYDRTGYEWTNKNGTTISVAPESGGWACRIQTEEDAGDCTMVAWRMLAFSGHEHWDKDKALLWSYVMAAEVRPDGTWPNPMEHGNKT